MDMVPDPNSSRELRSAALRFAEPLTGLTTRRVSEPSTAISRIEILFTILVLVLSTGAFVNLFPGEQGLEGQAQGLLFAQVLWSLLYIVMLWLIRNQIAEIGRLLWRERLLTLLLGWALVSVLWSIDRQATFRHFVALIASSIFGIYLGIRYNMRQQLRYLLIALGIVTIASAVACIVFPTYGISADNPLVQQGWQGVFSAKNNLGTVAVLLALVLALRLARSYYQGIILIGLAFVFILIIQTQSKTALVYFVLAMAAFPVVRTFQRNPTKRKKILFFTFSGLSGLALWSYYSWESFVGYLGKDPELTGRVVLWYSALTWIREKPLLGYGYDAFWSDYYGPAADFRVASGWLVATHAHNGFINLWLDLGLIGVLLFILGFVISFKRAIILAKVTTTAEGLWPVIVLTFLFVYSLTEIGFMERNNLYWILYVSVMFSLRQAFAQRLQTANYR